MGGRVLELSKKMLPEILKRIWREEALPIWKRVYQFFKNIWDSYIFPFFQNIWQKILRILGREVQKRKPIIEEEFKKEKEEMKEEVPKVGKSLWERFKELIK